MSVNDLYKPIYAASWALVIGINEYQIAPPLSFARQDAEAFAGLLKTAFGFQNDKVTLLIDERATRQEIFSAFMRFTQDAVGDDDRILVFLLVMAARARVREER